MRRTNHDEMRKAFAAAGITGLVLAILGILAPGPLVGAAAAPLALPAVVIGAPMAIISAVVVVSIKSKKPRK